jgi:peptide/nickel transport system permease protein
VKRSASPRPALAVLGALYALVLAAGWIAPYDVHEQNRDLAWAPPTRPRFVDAEGRFQLRPFVYRQVERPGRFGQYVEDRSRAFPLRFFVTRPSTGRRHLFGVDGEARVFLLGADRFGRDQLSRLLHGGRVSLGAGLLAGLLAVALGIAAGTAAGFYGGWIDAATMRLGELFMALPWLYLLLAVRAVLPLDLTPAGAFLATTAVVGTLSWVRPARLVRGVVLSAREREFVLAARGFGASDLYLLRRHVLPQAAAVVLTQLALLVPRLVLAEVTLSFLGLGVAEPTPSWGNMLAALRQVHVLTSYWWASAPAAALVAVVLSYHRLASALQQLLGKPTP